MILSRWLRPAAQSPTLIVLVIGSGLFLNGYDSALGQAVACLLNVLLLAAMIVAHPPSVRFWRRAAPVLRLSGLALLWLVLVRFSDGWVPGGTGVPFAPDLFLPKFLSVVAGLAALLIGARAGWRGRRRQDLIDQLLLVILAHLLLAVFLRAAPHAGVWDSWALVRDSRFAGLIGNPNVTAAVCGVAAVLALGSALGLVTRRATGRRRPADAARGALYSGTLLIALACQLLTASRFPVLVTYGLLALLLLGERRSILRHARRYLPAFAGAASVTAAILVLYSDLWLERFSTLEGEVGMRLQLWRLYSGAVWDSPIFGYGAGSFSSLNAFLLRDEVGAPAPWTINSAHDVVLQLLLAGGLPYAALMILAGIRLARDVLGRWPWRQWDALQRALVGAVLLMLACAMVDILLDVPASACLMLLLAGIAWGQALSRHAPVAHLEQPPAQEYPRVGRGIA
jgi:hypothetical protein